MGDTGPCGPCSEIHLDSRTPDEKAKVAGRELVNKDDPQVIEIWNIVFMQYERKADGHLEPLGMNVIDTGMGFERLVRALQGKHSNYDTDVFQPIIKEISRLSGKEYGKTEDVDVAMRVIADHLRAVAFSIADGQLPSNAKAGYVIRRILRRAVRYAYTFLDQKEAFMFKLLPVLIQEMGPSYPELPGQRELIGRVIKEEEDSFLRTLDKGISMLTDAIDELKAEGKTVLDGSKAFRLFDTFGFPLDLTELICREAGIEVDEKQFDVEMQAQKARARNAAQVENGDWVVVGDADENQEQQFVGYDYSEYNCHITRYRMVKQKKTTFYELVLDQTPFYGEMGGQVGEQGVLVSEDETVTIIDSKRENGQTVHIVKELPKNLEAEFMACVDTDKRNASAANHTATHLLDYALKQVLGDHVEQKGSYVSPDTLRFDFSHFEKVSDEQLREVERMVNAMIREDIHLNEHRDTPIEEAKKLGAIALFGEKYGDKVRVIQFGPSVEFCGGIHATSTGRIGMFKILTESSVAAGIRRIEAATGKNWEEMCYDQEDRMRGIRALFNNAKDLQGAIEKFLNENAELKKTVESYKAQQIERVKADLLAKAEVRDGVTIVKATVHMDAAGAKDLVFKLREAVPEKLVCIIGAESQGRPSLNIMFSEDIVKTGLNAGKLVREAAKLIKGGGGGQPHFAQAGGKDASGLKEACDKVIELIKEQM